MSGAGLMMLQELPCLSGASALCLSLIYNSYTSTTKKKNEGPICNDVSFDHKHNLAWLGAVITHYKCAIQHTYG